MTVDVHTHELARPFLVVATQNPVEYEGTYPLPEAQLDRFMVRVSLGYPSADDEAEMLAEHAARRPRARPRAGRRRRRGAGRPAGRRRACTRASRCAATSSPCSRARAATRAPSSAPHPRAGLMLLKAAKALAALEGRDHALPDDVQALAPGGAHAPAAARARGRRRRAAPTSSATSSSGSRRCR